MSLLLVLFDGVSVAVSSFPVAFTMAVVAVLLVELLGFFPLVAFAGGRNKAQPGGSGGEKRGRFHPGAGVADRPPMASGLSRQCAVICRPRGPPGGKGIDNETEETSERNGI